MTDLATRHQQQLIQPAWKGWSYSFRAVFYLGEMEFHPAESQFLLSKDKGYLSVRAKSDESHHILIIFLFIQNQTNENSTNIFTFDKNNLPSWLHTDAIFL